jgi:hypothetical protein
MMIVLTEHDISRLSADCRAELQRLLFERSADEAPSRDEPFVFDFPDTYQPSFEEEQDNDARQGKRVISITPDDAKALVANISERSLQTLTLFASGRPIALTELVGVERPYENLTDLKRSFVGAVTRRLRTVTRNRQAALFLQTSVADGDIPAIAIRQSSAEALRIALNLNPLSEEE